MSVENGKVCCNCRHCIRSRDEKYNMTVCRCEVFDKYCSECHTRFAQTHWSVWEDGSLPRNFCPNCGADTREEDA